MKRLRVIYVKEDLTKHIRGFNRDIEFFPLERGKYRLKKHPLVSFNVISYDEPNLTIDCKNNSIHLKDGQYTYFTLKKTEKNKIDIFFEIVEEKTEEEVEEEEMSAKSIPAMFLKFHVKSSEVDTYSSNEKTEDFELPIILNEKRRIPVLDNDVVIKEIISDNEVIVDIQGHWGKEITVTSNKESVFKASDSYGSNDNFRAFSIEMSIKLVKK